MMQAEQIDVAKELASVKNALEALVAGGEAALEGRAWRAAVAAVFALCSVQPPHFPQLLQQTSDILRRHLNSVREDILGTTTATSGKVTEISGKATETSGKATETSGKATETSGKATETSGKATETSGKATATSGKATATSGKATETSGKATATSGKATETSGKATAASGKATAAPVNATAAPDNAPATPTNAPAAPTDVAATLNRVGANLNLNLAPIFSDTRPSANCDAHKALLERYATAWDTFLKTIKTMDQMYIHFNLRLLTLRKARDLKDDVKCACKEPRMYTPWSITYSSWPKELKEFALHKWLECVLVPAGRVLRWSVTRALRSECEGRPFVSQAVLRSVVDSFRDVREYDTVDKGALHREWVVRPYLLAVRGQHAERAQALLARGDLSHFMSHMLAVNVQELVTLLPYFGQVLCRDVQVNFQQAAVVPHVGRLHAAAGGVLCAAAGGGARARHDLHHLYLLLRVVGALPPLLGAARAHVVADGRATLRLDHDTEMHEHFVNVIMTIRQKYCMLFAAAFDGDRLLCLGVLDKALRELVNGDIPDAAAAVSGGGGSTTRRAPELLARYCDVLLRRGDDQFTQIKLAAASFIFLHLDQKDVFQDTYQKMLAKRLLNHSSSLRLEETLIARLRLAGTEFNGKLHAMYKDIAASFVLNEKFREWTEEKREPFLWGDDEDCGENTAQVLQGWAWPLANAPTQWVAPAPLESYTRKFETFYKQRHRHRRLAWLHELSTGELVLRYTARRHELTATGAQCGLLLAFQERERWGAEELRERLRLQRNDWVRQLQPLLKLRLLLADGDVEGGDTPDGDTRGGDTPDGDARSGDAAARATLTLNLDFSHEQLKIKITCSKASAKQPAPSPAAQAQAQAPSRHDLRCKAYTQALLMRIMKKHKVLHRDALLQETRAQSEGWFSPAPELLQTYIDELVFKEYLEPVPGDSHTYKYLP